MDEQINNLGKKNASLYNPLNYNLIWICGILLGLLALCLSISHGYIYHGSVFSQADMFVESSIFWIIIYRMFGDHQKAAINALCASLGIILLQFFLNKYGNSSIFQHIEIINLILAIIPAIIFLSVIGEVTFKLIVGLIVFGALSMTPIIETTFSNILTFNFLRSEFLDTFFTVIKTMFMTMAIILLKIEIIKQVLLFQDKEFKDTLLDLNKEYPKWHNIVMFFITRIALDITIFRYSTVIMHSLRLNNDSNAMNYYTLLIGWMITLFFFAWFHRKFLIEYLLSYNKVPSYLYWTLLIPYVNFIIFIISYFLVGDKIAIENRKANLQSASKINDSENIGYIILFLQGLSLIISIVKSEYNNVFIGVVAFIAMIYFIKAKPIAFYMLTGFYLAILIIFALPSNHSSVSRSGLYISLPLIITTIYLMYGIFYVGQFSTENDTDEALIDKL